MIEQLVRMYESGAITVDHLVVESLRRLAPEKPALVLCHLPRDVLAQMLDYAIQYRPWTMRTNYGLQPSLDQVSAAKQWIEANVAGASAARIGLLRSNQ